MATLTKLPSGTWQVQVRRKGKDASETFLRHGEAWARAVELKIDRGEPILCNTTTKTFGGLIDLHKGDLAQVGKSLGRSKAASLEFLSARLRMTFGMPALGEILEDGDITAILAFIKPNWPDRICAVQAERNGGQVLLRSASEGLGRPAAESRAVAHGPAVYRMPFAT